MDIDVDDAGRGDASPATTSAAVGTSATSSAASGACPNPAWTRAPWDVERRGHLFQASTTTTFTTRTRSTLGLVRECDDDDPSGVVGDAAPAMLPPKRPTMQTRTMPLADASTSTSARSWDECYRTSQDIRCERQRGTFRVYTTMSASSSASSFAGEDVVYLVCLHGCPYTSMTWAPCAEVVRTRRRMGDSTRPAAASGRMEIVAIDLRGHGATTCDDGDGAVTFDPDVMARDAYETSLEVFARLGHSRENPAKVVVVGHSMGGAIAARLAGLLETAPCDRDEDEARVMSLRGLALVDIVEGSAKRALPLMRAFIEARPTSFDSLKHAMLWASSKGGGTTNAHSAAISLPSQLRVERDDDGRERFVWRTNLRATEPYWMSWYEGLSQRFLAVRAPKLLLLAGSDRLDTALTIAQMQGKFQMTLLPKAGHAIQEDDPEAVTTALENFCSRFVWKTQQQHAAIGG